MIVDVTVDKVWTDAEIETAVQATIRQTVSQEDELKAARLGRLGVKSQDDSEFIEFVDVAILAAIADGRQARIDNEIVKARIASYPVETEILADAALPEGLGTFI